MASISRQCLLQTTNRLFPAVDYERFRRGTETEINKVLWLLRTYGAFRIRNHGLSPEKTADCFRYAKELFSGPAELKNSMPLYSSFDKEKVGNKSIPKESLEFRVGRHIREKSPWPTGPALAISEELSRILPGLLESLSKALQLDTSLNHHRGGDYEDNLCLHHYPATNRLERNPAHRDFGLLTLLIQEDQDADVDSTSSNGLQIADLTSTNARKSQDINDSARFVPISPEAGDITVLVGISLKKLARKVQIAPGVHRVVADGEGGGKVAEGPRYSIAYFVHPDVGTELDGRGETAGEYLQRRREISHIPS